MPSWPAGVPAVPLLDGGWTETQAETRLRTAMDAGPAKVRRRTTAGVAPAQAVFLMTSSELAAFEAWVEGDLGGGALSFDFTHPRSGATVTARLTQAYGVVPADAINQVTSEGLWRVTVPMEILP